MLKMTKVKLEPIPDLNMYIFFEKCICGRISYSYSRYSKANNKYLKYEDPKRRRIKTYLKYTKKLCELHKNYPLVPYKI